MLIKIIAICIALSVSIISVWVAYQLSKSIMFYFIEDNLKEYKSNK